MRIIPAIDIIDGKCVRLTKGDYNSKKIYNSNPLEVAKEFEDNGIKFLHLVDLDGAKSNQIINYSVLEKIASRTNLVIDFGGGLKSSKDVQIAFDSGANQITAGTVAVKNEILFLEWLKFYGNSKIILGADVANGFVATDGWLEKSTLDIIQFIDKYEKNGIEYVICTDIEKDGMLEGSSKDLYQKIISDSSVKLIASGGINSMHDLEKLKLIGCDGAIIGKAIYEGIISLKEISKLC